MKDKGLEKEVISILKRVWDDSHRYKNLRIGDLVKDTKKGEVGIVIGFKPSIMIHDSESLRDLGVEARNKVNFNASESTDGTLFGKTPIAILQTLEPSNSVDCDRGALEFRIRYVSESNLIRLEQGTGGYNEGLTLIKEHCSSECILECTSECSLFKYR